MTAAYRCRTKVGFGAVGCLLILFLVPAASSARAGQSTSPGSGQIKPANASQVSFKRDVAPILARQCLACHGPEKSKGKYRLDTFSRLLMPGSGNQSPVKAGATDQSEIYKRITTSDVDDRMPQKADPLPGGQIALIKRWIDEGASYDGADPGDSLSSIVPEIAHPAPPDQYARPMPITALAISPDAKIIAASGYFEVTLWDVSSGQLVGRINNIAQQTLGLAYSPDGKFLAIAAGTPGLSGEVWLIDLITPRIDSSKKTDELAVPGAVEKPAITQAPAARLLDRISDVMTVVRFSPDGLWLAAGGSDNAIRIYNPTTGKRERLIEQHADWVTDLAFSPDGGKLVSGSRDKSCRVFDVKTGAMESAFLESEEPVLAVAWSDDGKRVFSGGRDHKIKRWNIADAKKIAEIALDPADVSRLGTTAGILLATTSSGQVLAFSQKTRNRTREFFRLPDWAYSLAVNEQHGLVVAGGYDGRIGVCGLEGNSVKLFLAAPGLAKGIESKAGSSK